MMTSMISSLIVLLIMIVDNGLAAAAQKGGGTITVFIQHSGGVTAIDVASDATVSELFDMVHHVTELPKSFGLSCAGTRLNDLNARLCDVGVGTESRLVALPPVFESRRGGKIQDFVVDNIGTTATLSSGQRKSVVCFANKTDIGQTTKMVVRVTNGCYLWATASDSSHMLPPTVGDKFIIADQGITDVTITVAAKPDDIYITYEPSSGPRQVVQQDEAGLATGLCGKCRVQICVSAAEREQDSEDVIVEFINFEHLSE